MELEVTRSILDIYQDILLKESDITLRVDVRRTMHKLRKLSNIMSEDEKHRLLVRMEKQAQLIQKASLKLRFEELVHSIRTDELNQKKKLYEVKRIMGFKFRSDKSRMYLVRWEGYDSDDDTWEPVHRLLEDNCGDLIAKFHKKHMRF